MQSIAHDRTMVLLLMVFALLILGTFMDMAPLIIIATPIFLPVAKAYGVDPVHFGVILILSCGIGLLTPPVGSVLFIGSAIGRIDVAKAVRGLVASRWSLIHQGPGGTAMSRSLVPSPALRVPRAAIPTSELNLFWLASGQAISRPRIVPVPVENRSTSMPIRCSIDTNRFGSG